MDRYQFPHITRIEQCLEAIKGCDRFFVAERDGHQIINYQAMDNETFPRVGDSSGFEFSHGAVRYAMDAAIRRECRGIVFDSDGNIISRRLHKFFNLGERPETAKVLLTDPHVIMEKLDGSMITPIPIRGHIRWGTKMGLTEVGFQAEEFVSDKKVYLDFAEHCIAHHLTPIFEWCSRKQRIVVDYPEDKLVLIAVRNTFTGEYQPYENMVGFGKFWKIPVVKTMGNLPRVSGYDDAAVLADDMKSHTTGGQEEGYCIRFDDGHMVKVKYDDYVRIHRAKDSILQEKRVVEMIINEKTDDVLPHLIDHDKKALEDYQMAFWTGMLRIKKLLHVFSVNWKRDVQRDRRRFAIETEGIMDPRHRSVIFATWDHPDNGLGDAIFEELKKRVAKNTGSGTAIDSWRWAWGDHKWRDYLNGSEADQGQLD